MGSSKKYSARHGMSKHPLFSVWAGILSRCYVESAGSYKAYGAKGVRVCDLWRYNFIEFYNWAIVNGWKKGLQIDKDIIPAKLGIPALLYSPETCIIVTVKTNANNKSTNKRYTYNGDSRTVAEWAEHIGMSKCTFGVRVRKWGLKGLLKRLWTLTV